MHKYEALIQQIQDKNLANELTTTLEDMADKYANIVNWYLLAKEKKLNLIPIITKKDVLRKVNDSTMLHYAAEFGSLDQIPVRLLSQETMTNKNLVGETALHIAAEYGHLPQVPKILLTERNLTLKNTNGSTPIHYAACGAYFSHLPKNVINSTTLCVKDQFGYTPLHHMAAIGQLGLVKEHLTFHTLTMENTRGETPLHRAGACKELENVPFECLTPEMLLIADNTGNSVIEQARRSSCLDQLLGFDFKDNQKIKEAVSPEWWAQNQSLTRQRSLLQLQVAQVDIDIF